MSRGYSLDLRRLVECVEAGASRHEAAERFEVSVQCNARTLVAYPQPRLRRGWGLPAPSGKAMVTGRRFPPPWHVVEHAGNPSV
jgi:hypothetical protein